MPEDRDAGPGLAKWLYRGLAVKRWLTILVLGICGLSLILGMVVIGTVVLALQKLGSSLLGTLEHTSVLPNLPVRGITEDIRSSPAPEDSLERSAGFEDLADRPGQER